MCSILALYHATESQNFTPNYKLCEFSEFKLLLLFNHVVLGHLSILILNKLIIKAQLILRPLTEFLNY